MALNNLGLVLWEQGRFAEAEPPLVEANNLAKALFLANGPDVASLQQSRAGHPDRGDLIGAETLFSEAMICCPRAIP
jgi:hypothetical protein